MLGLLLVCVQRKNESWESKVKILHPEISASQSNTEKSLQEAMSGFPGGSVIKNLAANAEDMGLIPAGFRKILHAIEQLSPYATTTEPMSHNY